MQLLSPRSWRQPVQALAFAGLLGASGALVGCSDTVSDRDIDFVTLPEVRRLTSEKAGTAQLVDARAPQEFALGHIPGAINRELAAVSERKDSIDPALARYKFLIVYGDDPGSGVARALAKRFMRAGHKGVRMFAGGIAEWKGSGLKLEASPGGAAGAGGAPARQ